MPKSFLPRIPVNFLRADNLRTRQFNIGVLINVFFRRFRSRYRFSFDYFRLMHPNLIRGRRCHRNVGRHLFGKTAVRWRRRMMYDLRQRFFELYATFRRNFRRRLLVMLGPVFVPVAVLSKAIRPLILLSERNKFLTVSNKTATEKVLQTVHRRPYSAVEQAIVERSIPAYADVVLLQRPSDFFAVSPLRPPL